MPKPPLMESPVSSNQTFARTLHDLGAAAWFGGALMGAVGLHGASSEMSGGDRIRVADIGWQRWQPWKTAAIATHVAGGLALLWGNKGRLAGQHGAMTTNIVKTGVFAAALGADLYAAALGSQIGQQQSSPVESVVKPADGTAQELEVIQQKLRVVQWVVPALTGLNIALSAKMGEQQRPTNLISGFVERLDPRG